MDAFGLGFAECSGSSLAIFSFTDSFADAMYSNIGRIDEQMEGKHARSRHRYRRPYADDTYAGDTYADGTLVAGVRPTNQSPYEKANDSHNQKVGGEPI
jgi:hypothetical protein